MPFDFQFLCYVLFATVLLGFNFVIVQKMNKPQQALLFYLSEFLRALFEGGTNALTGELEFLVIDIAAGEKIKKKILHSCVFSLLAWLGANDLHRVLYKLFKTAIKLIQHQLTFFNGSCTQSLNLIV